MLTVDRLGAGARRDLGELILMSGKNVRAGGQAAGPARELRAAYRRLRRRFGHQHWWPGDTPFEICVGAILTQNTSWSNVERAIANLKLGGHLEPRRLYRVPEEELARLIRPSGYFNIKARRLRHFLRVLIEEWQGDLGRMLQGSTPAVRERLLAIPGIGPETADSMLLYAGAHRVFVVDAYTRRVFARHGWCSAGASYGEVQALCERCLGHRPGSEIVDYWRDYHAQLVRVGKHYCRKRNPRCGICPLRDWLPGGAPLGLVFGAGSG